MFIFKPRHNNIYIGMVYQCMRGVCNIPITRRYAMARGWKLFEDNFSVNARESSSLKNVWRSRRTTVASVGYHSYIAEFQ